MLACGAPSGKVSTIPGHGWPEVALENEPSGHGEGSLVS
ncbi:unnamed protein product [Cuscuta europaea]|uniref:Uncharacterized protein n=1 Tax=Cuscuta europaea TaxID=41803 RepID=A0A9P1EFD0_CUSEU|nr:unnamed protein product [Cuscuta europaea]